MRTIYKNNPIATVIRNYINKKSGKVTTARDEIQRRFFGLDWKDQKKILAAFLDAGQADRNWAYSRLLDLWDASFEAKVHELWEAYHEERCAWVIIRHFPVDFIRNNVNTFNEGRDYYFICRRLVADADFVIDKNRLSKTDYLMALACGERQISSDEATDVLFSIVQDVCFSWNPSIELPRSYIPIRSRMMAASDFTNISIALYYLEKMGREDVVSAFRMWERDVQADVSSSEMYQSLTRQSLSDYYYMEKLAVIVQKCLYYALPVKYKTMTDEEYNNKE